VHGLNHTLRIKHTQRSEVLAQFRGNISSLDFSGVFALTRRGSADDLTMFTLFSTSRAICNSMPLADSSYAAEMGSTDLRLVTALLFTRDRFPHWSHDAAE